MNAWWSPKKSLPLCLISLLLAACAPEAPRKASAEKKATAAQPAAGNGARSPEPEPEPPPFAPVADAAILATTSAALEPELGMPVGFVVLGPERHAPIAVKHTSSATLRLVGLRADELARVRPLLGVHQAGTDPFAKLPRSIAARLKTRGVVEGETTADVFGTGAAEFVLAALEAPGAGSRVGLFQRGALSVLSKIGEESGLIWVTSTRTGRPVAGANVVLRQGGSQRFHGRTDENGLLALPPERRLRLQYVAGAEDPDIQSPLEVIATSGKHVVISSESWSTGVEPWQFKLPESYYRGHDALRGSISSERGIYRPGERVHLLGVLRRRLANGKLAPPPGRVSLKISDPDGNSVHSENVSLTEFGTFRGEFAIAASARLGGYSVVVRKDEAELRGGFEVGEYRGVRFEVKLPPAGVADLAAGQLTLPVSAAYLYGSPVAGGKLSWHISGRKKRDFGSWAEGYQFGATEAVCGYDCYGSEFLNLDELARGETELDANGRAVIQTPIATQDNGRLASQALDLVVEASVQDTAGDVVVGRSTQTLLQSRALVGLASEDWVVSPKQGWSVKLLVANAAGVLKAGETVGVRLKRRKWVGYSTEHGGEARAQGGYEDELVTERSVTSTGQPLPLHFALPAGGEYRLEAALDGETNGASTSVWAYGGDAYGVWDNHARMAIRADKSSYRSGETARLYAEVPYEKAWGLVTLEREGILSARVLRLDGAGTPIEIPLDERRVPNVFASVAVVPEGLGASAGPSAGPPLRIGYHELQVNAEKRRLRVEVRPRDPRARPGDRVDVAVRVTDHRGRPARAEVTLWAADEGVLKLTGYATPDPFAPAYARHSHQVRTAASLLRWVTGSGDDYSEYGGDVAPESGAGAALRSRFLSTAFFSKGIVTDAAGAARVTLPLPDNLTRWRVMAVAADGGERFGSEETAIETSKPLQIEPALPRFLTRGDQVDATLVVHNRTPKKGAVAVRLDVRGATLTGAATRTIELEAGAQAPVRFAVQAGALGTARFRATASLGAERDGFDVALPVHAPTPWQTELVGEGRLDEPRTLALELPKTAEAGLAELDVALAPSVLASIGSSVDALIEYPHGCVEQTTSRLIPMVLLEEVLRSSGDRRLTGREHRDAMEQAVRHVLRHQNDDGGFGLWPSSPSEGFLTAYALFGLFTAKDHGYAIPASPLARGLEYLASHAAQGDDMHGQFAPEDTRPFAAYVLAAAKEDDRGLGAKLSQAKRELSRFGVALLGAAFAERKQPAAELLGDLGGAMRRTRLGALVSDGDEPDSGLFGYGRDLRATAASVHALTLAGKVREADALVAGILDERRPDGSWGTTYNNLWALYALVDYAESTRTASAGGRVKLAFGAGAPANLDVSKTTRYQNFRFAGDRLPAPGERRELQIRAPKGSNLRYAARLRWTSSVGAHAPVDRGFSLRRALFDAATGAPVQAPKQGQLLRVRLELTTPEAREQVALIDRLPAGFEPVDTALATSASDRGAQASVAGWVHRELHDERVTHFADRLAAGTHGAEYLVRATRTGSFVRPPVSAEMMYRPDVYGQGAIETLVVE